MNAHHGAAKPRSRQAEALRAALRPAGSLQPRLACDYLVKGWLDRGAFSIAYGEAGSTKSFCVLDLALHVAARAPWHGARTAAEAGPVIYIAAEGGGGFANRVAAWALTYPELWPAARERFLALLAPLDLCRANDAEHLVAALEDMAPSLIVVDTLARSRGAGDENAGGGHGRLRPEHRPDPRRHRGARSRSAPCGKGHHAWRSRPLFAAGGLRERARRAYCALSSL